MGICVVREVKWVLGCLREFYSHFVDSLCGGDYSEKNDLIASKVLLRFFFFVLFCFPFLLHFFELYTFAHFFFFFFFFFFFSPKI